jgi:hypothetical protein
VKGDFTSREVIERMVKATVLTVVTDEKTGALMVQRTAPPPGKAAPTPSSDSPVQNKPSPTTPVRPKSKINRLASLLVAAILPLPAVATAAEAPEKPEEKTVELSPFTVSSDKDTGYQATNTLAGSRLNTPIKDLGGAISVYTKDFLNDIGATSTNDLLIYATGMEAAGPGGNFSNGAGSDITTAGVVGDGVRNAPQNSSRGRGLATPTYTRGFFISEVPIEGYNTNAVTVNRGPNAILFGVASAAGVVDTTLNQAELTKNFGRTEFRYGDNDSLRGSLDLNVLLVPKKVALRLDGLKDRERFVQRPTFENKDRLYGALTVKPFSTTTIKANFETGKTRANRPYSVLPMDSTALWIADGRKPFDWTFYDDPARNPNAAAQNAGGNIPGTTTPFRGFILDGVQTFNTIAWQIANSSTGGGAVATGFRTNQPNSNITGSGSLTVNSVRNQVVDPLLNRDGAADTANFYETRNIGEMLAASFPDGRVPAGIKLQGFTNFNAFDWKNQEIDETGRQSEDFRNHNISLEQTALKDHVGIELAYFREHYERRNQNNYLSTQSNANQVRIDANVTLPDGRPNPNLGRPFVDSAQAIYNQNVFERKSMRATAFARYDFREMSPTWGKWIGRHTVTVLGEQTRRDTMTIQSKLGFFGPYEENIAVSPYDFNRLGKFYSYIGPSLVGNNNPLRLSPVQVAPLTDGSKVNVNLFEVAAGDPSQAKVVTEQYTVRKIFRNGFYNRDLIKSKAANLMSYWLDDLVITNFGLRRDDDYFVQFAPPNNTTPEGLANVFRSERSLRDFVLPDTPPFVAGKQVKSYSMVLRWPQKLLSLPKGMDLSVFGNYSENFSPNGSSTDAYGNVLASPTGKTKEYGLNFSAFNDKLSLRFNTYETKIQGLILGRPTSMSSMINNFVLQTIPAWVTEVNRNPNASRQADIDLILNALKPYDIPKLYQFNYSGSADTQNLSLTTTSLPGYTDTANYVAKGWESDIVFNPTRNWRILLNLAKTESIQSNLLPATLELRARLDPVVKALANRPKAASAAGYVFPTDPVTGKVTSLDAGAGEQTVAQFFAATVDPQLANQLAAEGVSAPEVRKYRANLVTNYSFDRQGRLRGFGIGTGIRWQDKVGIGYPTTYTPSGTIFIDRNKPYYGPAETNVDFFGSYTRKIWSNRIDWKIQLNVRNAIGKGDLIPITAQPDGSPASVRLAPDRRWYVTNSFSF